MALHGTGAEPLQVTDALERRGDTTSQLRIGDQLGHRSEAELDRLCVSQRSSEPLAKPSRSHRGARAVHEADEGRQLEIANGGGVERHGRVRGVGAHAEHLGSQACLVCLQVLEQQAEQAQNWFGRGVTSMERSVTTVLLSGLSFPSEEASRLKTAGVPPRIVTPKSVWRSRPSMRRRGSPRSARSAPRAARPSSRAAAPDRSPPAGLTAQEGWNRAARARYSGGTASQRSVKCVTPCPSVQR